MKKWCSKHIEDTKNWIKALIWKVCICWFTLYYRIIIIIIIIISSSSSSSSSSIIIIIISWCLL